MNLSTSYHLVAAVLMGLMGALLTLDWGANLVLALWNFVGCLCNFRKVRPADSYWMNVLIALDQLANSVIGGDPYETISSRSAKARANKRLWGCVLCMFLGWVATLIARKKTDHCALSLMPDVGDRAIIPDGE